MRIKSNYLDVMMIVRYKQLENKRKKKQEKTKNKNF